MNLIAELTAFFLGALHALEPGHGKSAIAAYAVGYRSSLRHILVLGLTTAFAHTISDNARQVRHFRAARRRVSGVKNRFGEKSASGGGEKRQRIAQQ